MEEILMTDINNKVPIDLDDPGNFRPLLNNIQGNIIKGHARDFANHIFVTFTADAASVRKWIREELEPKVTSAWQQQEDAKDFRRTGRDDIPFLSVFLSASGYRFLELSNEMPQEHFGRSFRDGMRSSGPALNDPVPDKWDPIWSRHPEVHCMILTANDNYRQLQQDTDNIIRLLTGTGGHFIEKGTMLYPEGDKNKPREHFGFIDGISNPIFDKQDLKQEDGYQANGAGWQFTHWDPFASLSLVLVKESGDSPADPRYGSFLVFRKLEQNVGAFKKDIERLSTELGGSQEARAMALVMGRFQDGTPLTVHQTPVPSDPVHNDFSFTSQGGCCPFRGHIRRANPRGEQEQHEGTRRIARRGMPYDDQETKRAIDLSDSPEVDVGLFFMCYQSDIAYHFEHIQQWCNWSFNFDAIVGQGAAVRSLPEDEQRHNTAWPRKWASTAAEKRSFIGTWPAEDRVDNVEFGRHVKLKGGEYFFAPSKPFLKNLP
jgi:Dyp-type peroxidase family